MLARFLQCLTAYFRLRFVGTAPSSFVSMPGSGAPSSPVGIETQGASDNIQSQAAFLAALQANAAPMTGYQNYKSIATSATVTLNAAGLPGGVAGACILWTGSTATAATLDSTQNIINGMPGAFVGMTALMNFANSSSATVTLTAGDANTTLSGTTTNVANAMRLYQIKITNLAAPSLTTPNVAHPNAPGATSTNTTTTTAAVAAGVPSTTNTSVVIPVTASTGMIANQSVLQVVNVDGSVTVGLITNISTLNITINTVNTKAIASGASVYVWNPAVTFTGMFSLLAQAAGLIA
jgi:hypothetical protein